MANRRRPLQDDASSGQVSSGPPMGPTGPLPGSPPPGDFPAGDGSFGEEGRVGETPRERPGGAAPGGSGGVFGPLATTSRPRTPTPGAGSQPVEVAPPVSEPGPLPFDPMGGGSPDVGLASPMRGGLYGMAGGLKGGGLGVPLDPQSNQTSDPIEGLIQLLMKGGAV